MLIALALALAIDEPVAAAAATDAPPPPVATAAPSTTPTPQTVSPILRLPAQAPPILRLPAQTPPVQPAIRFVWRDHPSIRAGRNFRLDFAVKIQEDFRQAGDEPLDFEEWDLHRARFGIEGELFRHITFQVERETTTDTAGNPTKSPWKDVWVDADYINAAQIRVGKMKVPFGLDQLNSDSDLDFVFRSLGGSFLSPGRDLGIMLHGRFFMRGLNYWAGVFEQDGDNSQSTSLTHPIVGGDETVAGRLTVRPLRKLGGPFAGTEIGTSLAFTSVNDSTVLDNGVNSVIANGLRARTPVSQYTFFEPMFVKGQRQRIGVDVEWFHGPLSASLEYIMVNDQRQGQSIRSTDLSDVRYRSWYIEGAWLLTGETKEGGVTPKHPLFKGGIGALEVAGRHERLRVDSVVGQDTPFRNSRAETILPNADTVSTVGINWYLNRWGKIQFNAIHEKTDDAERSPIVGGAAWWSAVVRFQLAL